MWRYRSLWQPALATKAPATATAATTTAAPAAATTATTTVTTTAAAAAAASTTTTAAAADASVSQSVAPLSLRCLRVCQNRHRWPNHHCYEHSCRSVASTRLFICLLSRVRFDTCRMFCICFT